jgi:hypothetical protein
VSACALALNTQPETNEWLDSVFNEKDGQLPEIVIGGIDRDGVGAEGAPNYSLLWIDKLLAVGELLNLYPSYTSHSLFAEFPQLRNSFTAGWRMCVLGMQTPNIGDSGATGKMDKMQCDAKWIAKGFHYYQDPLIARAAYEANGNKGKGLLRDILSANPDAEAQSLAAAAASSTGPVAGSVNMPGFGLAKFEFGKGAKGSALWCYYGRNGGHGHRDQFNFSLYGFGLELTPDLGYPEFATPAWPNRIGWHANTLSHNTVVVDGAPEKDCWDAEPNFYFSQPGLGMFELKSREIYPQCSRFVRTLFFVEGDAANEAYAVDIFRVRGGRDHVLSFHGPPGPVTCDRVRFDAQTTGTYAGPDVAFATTGSQVPLGHSYLYNVERATSTPATFALDWKAQAPYRELKPKDDVHVRLHLLNECDDVALADGDPPQNKPGNPRRLRYALLHRAGENLDSTFVSVIEPYKKKPLIKSISRLETEPADAGGVALRVELASGKVDYLLSSAEGTTVSWGARMAGRAGFARMNGDDVMRSSVVLAERQEGDGKVLEFEHDPRKPATMLLSGDIGANNALAGQQIVVRNDGKRNGWYRIESSSRETSGTRIHCGNTTFVRGFKDRKDYTKGYIYDISDGMTYSIPMMMSSEAGIRRSAK